MITTAFAGVALVLVCCLVGLMWLVVLVLMIKIGYIAGLAFIVLSGWVAYTQIRHWELVSAAKRCKACLKGSALVWQYARVDGGPDRRYGSNFLKCRYCGTKHKLK